MDRGKDGEDAAMAGAAVKAIDAARAARMESARARLVNASAPRAVLSLIIKEGYPARRYPARTAAPV